MKKFLALLAGAGHGSVLAACGGINTPADDQQGDNNGDSQYPEYFAGMEDLIAAAQAEGELTVYGSCEEEYLTAACQHFEELFGIKVNAQRLSTGEVQAKIEEENGNPSADVWFGGTTDPYNVCAAEGLLEPYGWPPTLPTRSATCTRMPTATGTASGQGHPGLHGQHR